MKKVRLGKTGLSVTKTAFGALPIQRVDMAEAKRILRKAYDAGINYYDTANAYSDSEEKIGAAFAGLDRDTYVISTKSAGKDKKTVLTHIENSLKMLGTDHIDLLQLHNPAELSDPEDPEGAYAGALAAKGKGYIAHIGLTNHSRERALAGAASGLYETRQFPVSYLATAQEIALAARCRQLDLGIHLHERPMRAAS
jgi:aryl-alcohol dehydrogenase-like predicted oxidoreductase